MTNIDEHLPKLKKLRLGLFLPLVAYYRAKLGIAKASCPSVCLSVTLRYRDYIRSLEFLENYMGRAEPDVRPPVAASPSRKSM